MNAQKSSQSLVVKTNLQAGRFGIGMYKKGRGVDLFAPIVAKAGHVDHTVAQ